MLARQNTKQHAPHVEPKRRAREGNRTIRRLAEAETDYRAACSRREAELNRDEELTRFINDLAFDVEYAIEDYVGVVLSNSVYPDTFPVEHDTSSTLPPGN